MIRGRRSSPLGLSTTGTWTLHMPYRAWCVTGRGRSPQHRRSHQDQALGIPTIAMDYCCITEGSSPVLCFKCSQTGGIAAHAVMSKEVTPEIVRLLACDIDNMGHMRVLLKGDNKPGMKALAGCVREFRTHPTVVEESPEYEAQSNGLAERCMQTVNSLVRATKSALEHRLGGGTRRPPSADMDHSTHGMSAQQIPRGG